MDDDEIEFLGAVFGLGYEVGQAELEEEDVAST